MYELIELERIFISEVILMAKKYDIIVPIKIMRIEIISIKPKWGYNSLISKSFDSPIWSSESDESILTKIS